MKDEQENLPPEEGAEQTAENQGEQTPKNEELSDEMKTALAQKEHWRAKAEKAEAELQKARKNESQPSGVDPLEVTRLGKAISQYDEHETDLIIERAKGKFNTLSPSPQQIIEASKDEWTQIAITAKREKVEKEKALSPSSKQETTDRPKSIDEFLKTGSDEEVEKWMAEQGLWKPPHRRHDPKAFNSNY